MSTSQTKMVTVVYALGNGSHYRNAELRFSLRSIEKYLSNVANVVIVGNNPEGFKNFDHIPAKDPNMVPDTNIFNKLLLACESDKVTEDFLFVNDDHFLLDHFNAADFPYFYCGTLDYYVKSSRIRGLYYRRVESVARKYPDGKFFDVHTPILYNKKKFLALKDLYDYEKGMVIKSLYCNQYGVTDTEEITDFKRLEPPNRPTKMLSTFPRVKASLFRFIEEQFPLASKYEYYSSL